MTDSKYYVNLESVVEHVQLKLDTDCAAFQRLFDSNEGRHSFEDQVKLLQEVQASVRTIDILLGRCAVDGTPTDNSEFTVDRVRDDLQSRWGNPEFQGLTQTVNSVEAALMDQQPAATPEIPKFLSSKRSNNSSVAAVEPETT